MITSILSILIFYTSYIAVNFTSGNLEPYIGVFLNKMNRQANSLVMNKKGVTNIMSITPLHKSLIRYHFRPSYTLFISVLSYTLFISVPSE